jgi:hypothetical protein
MDLTPMDLTPGSVLLADWHTNVMLVVGGDGQVVAESLAGRTIAVRDAAGEDLGEVIACSPVLGLVVRLQLRDGRLFLRMDPETGEQAIAMVCEHRQIELVES